MTAEGAPRLDSSEAYARSRERDWTAFSANSGPLADHWEVWAKESFDWRPEISFFQPVGEDYDTLAEPLEPLRKALEGLAEIDLPPVEFLHVTCLQIGFLRAAGIYWSQVETVYANAAPRIHRIEPFMIRVGGISAHEDGLYLGVDDGFALREVRRQVALGVPTVAQNLKEAGIEVGIADRFVPEIPFAYFTGHGSRARVIEAITPHLETQLGEYEVSLIKMGRIAPDPDIHYPSLDVVAEIVLFGKNYRRGYHN